MVFKFNYGSIKKVNKVISYNNYMTCVCTFIV